MTYALEIKNLTKNFGAKAVIEPFSLEVEKGAFVALLGPSGCGKTTLLRMVAGLETPTSGEIRIDGRVVFSSAARMNIPPEDRGIGMVFQTYAVWPHMTVRENIAYPLKLRKIPKDEIDRRVNEILSLVKMDSLSHRYPHELSGGQQQRVALSRGLVMRPPILCLDEPLSNLDARLRAEMRTEIRELHRKTGITVLYVTHDQREAFEMATEILILNEGRIEQRSKPDKLRAKPQSGFVTEFLSHY